MLGWSAVRCWVCWCMRTSRAHTSTLIPMSRREGAGKVQGRGGGQGSAFIVIHGSFAHHLYFLFLLCPFTVSAGRPNTPPAVRQTARKWWPTSLQIDRQTNKQPNRHLVRHVRRLELSFVRSYGSDPIHPHYLLNPSLHTSLTHTLSLLPYRSVPFLYSFNHRMHATIGSAHAMPTERAGYCFLYPLPFFLIPSPIFLNLTCSQPSHPLLILSMLLLFLIAFSTSSSSPFLTTLIFSVSYTPLFFQLITPTSLILFYLISTFPCLLYSKTASERDSISTLSTKNHTTLLYSTLHYYTSLYNTILYFTLLYPTSHKALRYLTCLPAILPPPFLPPLLPPSGPSSYGIKLLQSIVYWLI